MVEHVELNFLCCSSIAISDAAVAALAAAAALISVYARARVEEGGQRQRIELAQHTTDKYERIYVSIALYVDVVTMFWVIKPTL